MTRWKEFAEMLGLKINEEFKIKENDNLYDELFRFKEEGLQLYDNKNNMWRYMVDVEGIIIDLLDGCCEIVKIPWKPKKNEIYYSYELHTDRVCLHYGWCDYDTEDLMHWKSGNCFKTEEEARTKGKEILEALKEEFNKS